MVLLGDFLCYRPSVVVVGISNAFLRLGFYVFRSRFEQSQKIVDQLKERGRTMTPEEIALNFSERFQKNYPKEPLWQMMNDLPEEIKQYASDVSNTEQKEIDSLKPISGTTPDKL